MMFYRLFIAETYLGGQAERAWTSGGNVLGAVFCMIYDKYINFYLYLSIYFFVSVPVNVFRF